MGLVEMVAARSVLLAQVSGDATRHDESVEVIALAEVLVISLGARTGSYGHKTSDDKKKHGIEYEQTKFMMDI